MNKIIIILFYIYLILFVSSCGSRKVVTSASKSEAKDVSREISKGVTTKENKQESKSESNEQLAKSDEKQESRILESFFENGILKERITELINSKSIDNSKKAQTNTVILHTYTDSTFNNTIYRDRTITKHVKDKATDTSNKPLYWMLFGIGCFAILVFGACKYFTRV